MFQYIEFLICLKKEMKANIADNFIVLSINVTSTVYLHVNYFADRKNVHMSLSSIWLHASTISATNKDQDDDDFNVEPSHVNYLFLAIMVHIYYLTNVDKRQTCIDYESTIYRYLMDQTTMIYK